MLLRKFRFFSEISENAGNSRNSSDVSIAKGALIGAGIAAGTAGVGIGSLALNKKIYENRLKSIERKTTEAILSGADTKKLSEERMKLAGLKPKGNSISGKIARKTGEWSKLISDTWKSGIKGKGKVLAAGTGVVAAGSAIGAGVNALRKRKASKSNNKE